MCIPHTTNNSTPKVGTKSGIDNRKNVTSTFSQKSITGKNWTIPIIQTVEIRATRFKVLVGIDTLYLKTGAGKLGIVQFDENGVYRMSEHYSLIKEPTGGKQYEFKAQLHYSGEHIGSILWGPRPHLAALVNTAKLEITNHILYDTVYGDLWPELIIDNPLELLGAEVKEVFRVDIALDSPRFIDFLEQVHGGEIIPVRFSSLGKSTFNLQLQKPEGFSFGSRSTGRYVRCYNKTLELQANKKDKGYIHHYFAANNLITGPIFDEVGRLEVELRNKYLKTVDGFNWRDLFDRSKLAKLAELALFGEGLPDEKGHRKKGWFEWVKADHSDSKINRRERIEIINFDEVKTDGYVRQKAIPAKSDRMEKIAIKKMIVNAALTVNPSAQAYYLGTAATICSEENLSDWLDYKTQQIQTDILRKAAAKEIEVQEEFLSGSLIDLLNEVNRSFRPLAIADCLDSSAGSILEHTMPEMAVYQAIITNP